MRETTRHREAFDRYWRLGAERSLERLHAELEAEGRGPSLRTLCEWSRQLHWQDRISDLERKARQAEDAARVAAIREMQERHAREGLLLQQRGTEWLAEFGAEDASPEAAIRAITEGAKLERLARGEATERTESVDPTAEQLREVSDDELQRFIALAEGTVEGAGPADAGESVGVGDGVPPGREPPPAAPPSAGGDRA